MEREQGMTSADLSHVYDLLAFILLVPPISHL